MFAVVLTLCERCWVFAVVLTLFWSCQEFAVVGILSSHSFEKRQTFAVLLTHCLRTSGVFPSNYALRHVWCLLSLSPCLDRQHVFPVLIICIERLQVFAVLLTQFKKKTKKNRCLLSSLSIEVREVFDFFFLVFKSGTSPVGTIDLYSTFLGTANSLMQWSH